MEHEAYQLPASSTALVTGATGFTGSVLVKKLIGQGVKVRAIARPSSRLGDLEGLPIEWIRGQVFDPNVLEAAMDGVNYVFHVAAGFREAKIQDEDYYHVHVKSTQLLAAEALKNPNFKRFIHVSTVGVHGHIDEPPADETYRFSPGDMYQKTKAEAEIWLHDFATNNNLPYAVVRPAAIYGPGDKRLLKIFKMAASPVFILLGKGKCLYHLIHVEDLTNAMILCAVHPGAQGEAFIVGDPEPIATAEIGRIAAEVYGNKLRILRLPVWPFFLAGDICEFVCKPLGLEPPIYRRRVAFFTKDRAFNTQKLRSLGFKYSRCTEEGIRATARWYREQGWL